MTATLLVELFTEELPPKALKKLGEVFADALTSELRNAGFLSDGSATSGYATPRRLAVSITDVSASATEPSRAVPLLPVSVAFGADGTPTDALQKAIRAKAGFDNF